MVCKSRGIDELQPQIREWTTPVPSTSLSSGHLPCRPLLHFYLSSPQELQPIWTQVARAPAWSFRTSPPLSTGWVSFVPSDQCVLRCQGICVFPLTKQSCTFSSFQPQGPPCGVWRIASRHGECELIVAMDSELEGPPEALRPSISKGCSRKKEKKNFFFFEIRSSNKDEKC